MEEYVLMAWCLCADSAITQRADLAKFAQLCLGPQVTCLLPRDSVSVRCQSSFNSKSITTKQDCCTSVVFTPVSHLLKSLHFCQSAPASDFFFLSLFCYLVNTRLGHKSEADLRAHLSARRNAFWHPAPYYLPPASRCDSGRTSSLLKCLSITAATGIKWKTLFSSFFLQL